MFRDDRILQVGKSRAPGCSLCWLRLAVWLLVAAAASAASAGTPGGAAEGTFPARVWASGEYLYCFTKGRALPPLATTSSAGTPSNQAGVLSNPATGVVIGGERVDEGGVAGARFGVGAWLDAQRRFGLGGRGFWLSEQSVSERAGPGAPPIVAAPYFNALLDMEDALLVAFPGASSGSAVAADVTRIWGAEGFLRVNAIRCERLSLDFVGGYQTSSIEDELAIESASQNLDPGAPVPVGTRRLVSDLFQLDNRFRGGAIGLLGEYRRGRWQLSLHAKLGLGSVRQRASILGSTLTDTPGSGESVSQGGLFALPTNSGDFARSRFAWAPELGLDLGFEPTPGITLRLGYSFLYWSRVAMAGEQIDRTINPSQLDGGALMGTARPDFSFRDGGLWVQGLNAGLQARF